MVSYLMEAFEGFEKRDIVRELFEDVSKLGGPAVALYRIPARDSVAC